MSTFVVGLDLAQVNDYSALVVIEKVEDLGYDLTSAKTYTVRDITSRHWADRGESTVRRTVRLNSGEEVDLADVPEAQLLGYHVRHIHRWPRGTAYPAIVSDVTEMLQRPPLGRDTTLVIDGTGCGRPVVDMFRQQLCAALVAVMITAGTAVTRDEWGYTHIPKRELVSTVQVHLQNGTLKWPARTKLPPVQTLEEELGNFQYKITAVGNDTYNARDGQHDDILLALALALYQAARPGIQVWWL